ncbi:MAG TPA: DMT family transporter [Patescibacteria group bacterium]
MDRLKGFSALFLTAMLYGIGGIFIRVLNREIGVFQQMYIRHFWGLIFAFVVFLFFVRKKISFKNIPIVALIAYSICFPSVVFFFTLSIIYTKIADATFGFYIASIIFSLFIGHFLFDERITKVKIAGLLFAVIGLLIFTFPLSKGIFNFGFLCAIICGIFDPITNSLRKHLTPKVDKRILIIFPLLGGVLVAGIPILFSHQSLFPHMSLLGEAVALFSGFQFLLFTYLTLVGFQNFDLNLGTIVISLELFFAPFFATIFLHEYLTVSEIIGGITIGLAIVIPHLQPLRRSKKFRELFSPLSL